MKNILFLFLCLFCIVSCNKNTEYQVNPTKCSGCGECKKACPNGVIAVDIINVDSGVYSDGTKYYDTTRRARIRPNRCVGCGKCKQACEKRNGKDGCAIEERK